MLRILNYIICLSLFGVFTTVPVFSQEKNNDAPKDSTVRFWQGLLVEMDVVPLLETALNNPQSYRLEGHAQLNIRNKYFPVVELGVAGIEKTGAGNIVFNTNGAFGRIGLDIPAMKPKDLTKRWENFALVGIRLGMSHFGYSYSHFDFEDAYWGGSTQVDATELNATKFWFELTGGIRVNVLKNIYMGWNVRNRHILNKSKSGGIAPYYIPGYGAEEGSRWGMNYTVGYRF